jgi:hypothetical protein
MIRSPRTLSFVCARRLWSSGSSYLRTFQLAEIAAQRLRPVRVRELAELDGEIRDEVLVFNKSCLQQQFLGGALERLPALRSRNACLADPVDLLLADEILVHFDGVVAASIAQAEHLASSLPKPVFLIHHHVDTRLPAGRKEWHGVRAGYFGELANTCHAGSVGDLVDFFSVDTSNSIEIPWAQHLPFYNVHYCLRSPRHFDGFKPATKLFMAAAFDAPVVIESANAEARRLLPRDYPYYVGSVELTEVRRVLHRLIETFGADEWRYARQCLSAIDCYRQDRVLDSIEEMMRTVG